MKFQTAMQIRQVLLSVADCKVSPVFARKVYKFIAYIEREELPFYQKELKKLREEFAERGGDGKIIGEKNGNIRVTEDKQDELNGRIKELNDMDIEVPALEFTMQELIENGVRLSPRDMSALDSIIKED